ncbi:MAG: VCBS repeat-containing protein [Candidatus Rokubacteria bacterium]|nr:VCBS repeat-containing protein [Candidatus Rokubacteria bacterium]
MKVREILKGRPTLSLTEQEAQALARSAGADYLLFGRFTKTGEAFSLDAGLLDLRSGRLVGRFVADGEGMSSVIPKVGVLAESVRKRFATLGPAPPPPAVGRFVPAPTSPLARPEPEARAAPSSPARPQPEAPAKPWISRPLALEIRGLGVGDVDQDGANDIVLLAKREVHVYRWQGSDLELVTRYTTGRSLEYLGVDVADLNGDGLAEIYVTAVAAGDSMSSFVLEWRGSDLRPVVSSLPWHLRVVQLPEGPTLVGQGRGREKMFDGLVRRLVWRGNQLVSGEPLALPGHVTLYSFAMADLDADGRAEVASLQARSPLILYDSQGRILARGARYGQTALYMVEKRGQNDDSEEGFQLPGRILAVNLPGQGTGLLVSRNHETIGVFERLRTFTNGEVIALQWKGDDLDEVWQTERLAYVADFAVAPLQPRGEPMLLIGTVTDFEGMFASGRSRLVVVPLTGSSASR